ncbi:hypothetical protein SUGI_0656530 [Cryptomeria japonica]|nr:hypothetical protein SUGI_0656530 [Cryptomeria japonica]
MRRSGNSSAEYGSTKFSMISYGKNAESTTSHQNDRMVIAKVLQATAECEENDNKTLQPKAVQFCTDGRNKDGVKTQGGGGCTDCKAVLPVFCLSEEVP